jgi:RNA polymerase sigma-B factor
MNSSSTGSKRTVEGAWAQHRKGAQQKSQQQPQQQRKVLSVEERNRIAQQNDRLALKVAHRMSGQCAEPLEDLIQLARIGLLKAVERYDPSKGVAFSSFAVPYIQGEVQHFLRDHWGHVKIPRRSIELASKVKQVQRRMVALGRNVPEEKIAESLGVSKARWTWTQQAVARKPLISLDDVQLSEEEEEDLQEEEALKQEMYKRLGKLKDPYRTCVMERFFKQMSDEAIARQQDTTPEQVRFWIEEGLNRLRNGQNEDRQRV